MEVRWNLSGEEIERESFRTIEAECDLHIKLPAPEWRVVRRLIHTTADPRIADTLVFRHDAVASGQGIAVRCADILRFQNDPFRPVPCPVAQAESWLWPGTAALPY